MKKSTGSVPVLIVSQDPLRIRSWGVMLCSVQKTQMDFDTFDTDLFAEINDSQAEIFDVIEEEKFDVEEFIKGDIDFWHLVCASCRSGTNPLALRAAWGYCFLKFKKRNANCH